MQRRISCIFESAFVPRNSAFFFFWQTFFKRRAIFFSLFHLLVHTYYYSRSLSHFRSRVLFLFLSRSFLFFLTFIRISWDYAPANFNSLWWTHERIRIILQIHCELNNDTKLKNNISLTRICSLVQWHSKWCYHVKYYIIILI